MSHTFILTKRVKTILQGLRKDLVCAKCGVPFQVGDKVVSHRSNSTRYFHEDCWLDLFIEVK